MNENRRDKQVLYAKVFRPKNPYTLMCKLDLRLWDMADYDFYAMVQLVLQPRGSSWSTQIM